ncbi:RNA polymerase subunit sigma-70, partial [Dysosmobacter welbionis]
KFLPALDNSKISCVLTTSALAEKIPPHIKGVFLCDRPKAALFEIHNRLARHPDYVGASAATVVGEGCSISPLAAIDCENVVIGDRVTIEPFVVIKGRVIIGNDVTIRSGAVIGCKGFSFSKDTQGQ